MEKRDYRVQEIVKELLGLAEVEHPSPEVVGKVKGLMRELRKMGYTNEEVSGLTGHRWKESTVKLYTRGTTVKRSQSEAEGNWICWRTFLARGMTLEEAEHALSLKKSLEARGLSVDEVSQFSADDVKKAQICSKRCRVYVYRKIKNSGSHLEQIAAVLSYRSQLEEMGINMDRLGTIGEISRTWGGYEAVLEALKNYGKSSNTHG